MANEARDLGEETRSAIRGIVLAAMRDAPSGDLCDALTDLLVSRLYSTAPSGVKETQMANEAMGAPEQGHVCWCGSLVLLKDMDGTPHECTCDFLDRRLDAADPLRQPREVITGYRDQAGMVWPDEDLGARSSFQPLEPVVETVHIGDSVRLRAAMEELERDADREDPDDPGANGIRYAVAVMRRALEQPTP